MKSGAKEKAHFQTPMQPTGKLETLPFELTN
jgi:hypothetical protein